MITLLLFVCIISRIPSIQSVGSIVDCNFEVDACGWWDPVGSAWFRANSSVGRIDPGHDHTCSQVLTIPGFGPMRPSCGMWQSTVPDFTGTQEFTLISPKIEPTTDSTMCFTFWYHFFGLDKARFELQVNRANNTFNAKTIWARVTPQSNNWIKAAVTIPMSADHGQYYLIFHAVLAAQYHDTVGLDDITLNYGSCPPTPDCDLETDLCSWSTVGNAARTNGTPIVRDHTTGVNLGHYVLNQAVGQPTQLTSKLTDLTSTFTNNIYQYCLKFWYYFGYQRGAQDVGSYIEINVTTYPTYTWVTKRLTVADAAADGMINNWFMFMMAVPNPRRTEGHNNSQVQITMLSKVPTSYIAIDDILVQNKGCEQPGICDFEADFCGWTSGLLGMQTLWLRNQGGNRNGFKAAPPTDTTTHTANGWFAMIPIEYLNRVGQASLQSPPLFGRAGYDCFSISYWALGSDSRTKVLTVIFQDFTKLGNPIIAQYFLNTSITTRWQHFHQELPKLPQRFGILINTYYTGINQVKSDIAIDDIDLNSDDCDDDMPFRPSSTTPVPYAERKWDCTFEYSCSEWKYDSNWNKTSYRALDPNIDGPRNDKTRNTPEGRYLLWMPDLNQTQSSIVSIINSTVLSTANPIHCLSFWYYDASEAQFQLDVQVKTPIYTLQPRSLRPNVASRSWKFLKVDIRTGQPNSFIMLRFSTPGTGAVKGSFALDEIKVRPGECGHIDDYTYTFDSFDNIDLARISPLNSYMGSLHDASTKSYPGAPEKDHTTGTGSYFLFMNRATDAFVLYKDELTIDHLPSMRYGRGPNSQTRCFRFAYQLAGNASLQVFVASQNSVTYGYSPSFVAYGAHTSWVVAQMPYSSYYEHKIIFQLEKPYDLTSYIALDDISISSHNCKRAVECDFDDDVCSYSSRNYKTDYDFARFVGPPVNIMWPGPPYDHTKRGYGGGYLYMTGFPSNRDMSRTSALQTPIESSRGSIASNMCISFWTQLTQPDAVLTLTLGLYGGRDPDTQGTTPNGSNTTYVPLLELKNLTESRWTRHYVQVNRTTFTNFHEFNLLIGGKTSLARTVLAVDDIELSRSSCEFSVQFKCKSGGPQIPTDKLCDFKKDCPDGSDEVDCGECDFEKGYDRNSMDDDACDWFNATDVSSDVDDSPSTSTSGGAWVPIAASLGFGPSVDGSGKSSGHYLLLSKARRNTPTQTYISYTKLTRNYRHYETAFKDAYFTCTLTFDYYLNSWGRRYQQANLRVFIGNDEDSAALKFYANSPSDSWQKGLARVGGFTGPFVLQFEASAYVVNETVALDNIKFQNCSLPDPIASGASCPASSEVLCDTTRVCIDPGDLCDFEDNCGDNWDERYDLCEAQINLNDPKLPPACAFEKSLELCGFELEKPMNTSAPYINWAYQVGYEYNLISYGGPGADHTTKDKDGQFLMLRTYKKELLGQRAQLYSPMMTSKDGDCIVRFFYFNNGNLSASSYNALKVWAQYADGNIEDSDTLFTSNTYVAGWNKARVHHSSGAPFRFVFDGQINGDTRGSISIDDVSFSDKCIRSSATRTPGKPHSSTAVTVILVLLFVGLISGLSFFAYRKHQSGELEPFIRRFIPVRSGGTSAASDKRTFVNNANYDN